MRNRRVLTAQISAIADKRATPIGFQPGDRRRDYAGLTFALILGRADCAEIRIVHSQTVEAHLCIHHARRPPKDGIARPTCDGADAFRIRRHTPTTVTRHPLSNTEEFRASNMEAQAETVWWPLW